MVQAIITGDIINSTKIDIIHRNSLMRMIAELLVELDNEFGTKSETFRGDSFQSLVENPAEALKIALIQKTFIKSQSPVKINTDRQNSQIFDARIAIGIGKIGLLSDRLATSGGEAFELSGQLLDKMKSKKQSLAIATNDSFYDELQTEFTLLDIVISKATALQCEVINRKLRGYTEIEISKQLQIIQSAVNQRSTSGNWNAIDTMVKRFEKIYTNEK